VIFDMALLLVLLVLLLVLLVLVAREWSV